MNSKYIMDMHIDFPELKDSVYEKIKELILTGDLKPGQKILQEKLATNLGVSRTPLLKALQLLENELLVESLPRRGMIVKEISTKEILDAFDCREGIESIAARLVAVNATKEEINVLNNVFNGINKNNNQTDLDVYFKADQKFHHLIIKFANNKILPRLEFIGNIHHISYQNGLIRPPAETIPEHDKILKAIRERDVDGAELAMKEHIRKSREVIMKTLK